MKYTKPKEKAKKLHILTDVKVEADLSNMLWRRNYYGKEEEKAKDLERAVKDFEDFLRDHRSQDMISLSVERVFEDVCSVCKDTWDIVDDKDGKYCGNCGADLDETSHA